MGWAARMREVTRCGHAVLRVEVAPGSGGVSGRVGWFELVSGDDTNGLDYKQIRQLTY